MANLQLRCNRSFRWDSDEMLFKLQTIALRDEIGVGLFKDKFEMTEHRMQETAGCFSRFTRQ